MASEKSLAVVLRVIEFSETSCIVWMFTRDFGKINALAKGARRPKSPFESALDLLAICRIVFLHKSSDTLDLLTEAKLQRRFRSASRDLSRLYAGYYIAELLDEMTGLGDPHPQLFDAADESLFDLDHEAEVAAVVLRFELTTLRVLGHLPSFGACAGCGEQIVTQGRVAFGALAGGVLCERCRIGKKQVVSVSAGVIKTLQRFAEPQGDAWRRTGIDARLRGELRGVVNHTITNLLGHRPRLHAYLGGLAN